MNDTKKSKSFSDKLKSRKLLVIVGIVVLLLILLFICRGWIRKTVLPHAVQSMYGSSVQKTYQEEMAKLQDPLTLLGYGTKSVDRDGCGMVVANEFKTQVDCIYDVKAFQKISTNPEGKKALNDNAVKLQALLKANGWQGEYANEGQQQTSLVKLMASLTSGIDYQPDAAYAKRVGNVECFFQNYTAFSGSDEPAVSAHISCSRTINVFGQPSWN